MSILAIQRHPNTFDKKEIKRQAIGREVEILEYVAMIPRESLDPSKEHPCPACQGDTRFRLVDPKAGAVYCNKCFDSDNGDFLAAVRHFRNVTFPEACRLCAEYLGMTPANHSPGANGNGKSIDPKSNGKPNGSANRTLSSELLPASKSVFSEESGSGSIPTGTTEDISGQKRDGAEAPTKPTLSPLAGTGMTERYAKLKSIPLESFKAFGAFDAIHTWEKSGKTSNCSRVPMYDPNGPKCSHTDFGDFGPLLKGMNAEGKSKGLFVPKSLRETLPQQWTEIVLTEGVKDAAALLDLGYPAIGLPGKELSAKFSPWFHGSVTIVPDLDTGGVSGAWKTASRLKYAKSIKIAQLPGEIVPSGGDGVREVRSNQGDEAVRAAIANAREVTSEEIEEALKAEKDSKEAKLKESGSVLDLTTIEGRTARANGLRFANRYRDEIRYVPSWEKFLVWDGSRWEIDLDDVQTVKRAMEFTDQLFSTARQSGAFEAINFVASTANSGIPKMVNFAKPYLAVDHKQFDANPFLFNCPNGTIDLRTGAIKPHDPKDNITKLCPTKFDPEAESFVWDRFLESLFDRQDEIDYLRRFAGHCLTGDVREQCLNIFWGGGANGKSTIVESLLATLGSGYAMSAPAEILMDTGKDRHPTEKADLFGMRFVVCNETESNRQLKESLVKQLTGGDTIRARRMKEDFWEFTPSHKLILLTNHKPIVKGQDHAIWRRLRLLPFVKQFWDQSKGETGPPELEADKTLSHRLKAMGESILAWAVQGCLEWQRDGLGASQSMQEATKAYRAESDVIGRFVDECCLQNDHMKIRASALNEALEKFCDETGSHKPHAKLVSEWMQKAGKEKCRSNGLWYLKIGLKYEKSKKTEEADTEETDKEMEGTEGMEPDFGLNQYL